MTASLEGYAPLALSRTLLRILITLNLIVGVLILALFVASLISGGFVMRALGVHPGTGSAALILGMRAIMVIGILAVPVANVVLTRLLAIVETVRVGDPFVVENAARLQTIAWAVLGLEVMHLAVHVVAKLASAGTQQLDMHGSYSVTPWLYILLLFVLARVFDQGARMRDELAATV